MKLLFKMRINLLTFLLFIKLFSDCVYAEDIADNVDNDMIVLHLDENMNRILFDLFVEVFGSNQQNSKIEVPVSTVAEIYRNYTQEQLVSLRLELNKLDERFDVIRNRVNGLQKQFLISNIEYSLSKNLSKYENTFLQIGEQLITIQKLVLKFTNKEKPFDINSIKNERTGRKSMIGSIFDRLAGLLLGINTDQSNSQQNTEPLNSNQLNRIITLMKALQSVKNVSANQIDGKMRSDLIKLQTMLYRLQKIQLLNRMADERVYQSSSNMNPYRYEAILNLVKLVGTSSGQNQLRAIMRLFTAPQTAERVRNTNNISQERLKIIMKTIEEQEKKRKQQIESQRQNQILDELLKNQKRQQQQIDSLIKLIETQNRNSNQNINSNINLSDNLFNDITTTTQRPTTTSNQNEILSKLKEQRRQLNNLLKTLGTEFNNNGNNNKQTNGPVPSNGGQTNNNFGKTQDTFNNLLKSIGPMIGMLAQSGALTPNQNQLTQNSLSELLNQKTFNDKIQYDSYKSKASKFIDLLGSILNF